MQQRYEGLEIRSALSRRLDFDQACGELAIILQRGYGSSPKKLQATLFDDVLIAVHNLPELEASHQFTAVAKVVQAAENAFPRQRKSQVVSDFKHAAVLQRRRIRIMESKVRCEFSRDILIDIFGRLDARSLARAATVCRLWRTAASDELLWKNLYKYNFKDQICNKLNGDSQGVQAHLASRNAISDESMSWKDLFTDLMKRHPLWLYASNRAFCINCDRPIWLDSKSKGYPTCSIAKNLHHKLKPLVPSQVLQYLLKEESTSSSASSSDSDADIEDTRTRVFKLWSIPKLQH